MRWSKKVRDRSVWRRTRATWKQSNDAINNFIRLSRERVQLKNKKVKLFFFLIFNFKAQNKKKLIFVFDQLWNFVTFNVIIILRVCSTFNTENRKLYKTHEENGEMMIFNIFRNNHSLLRLEGEKKNWIKNNFSFSSIWTKASL
jgi:hypothetical protein